MNFFVQFGSWTLWTCLNNPILFIYLFLKIKDFESLYQSKIGNSAKVSQKIFWQTHSEDMQPSLGKPLSLK